MSKRRMKFRLILDEDNRVFHVMDFTAGRPIERPDLPNVDGPDDACLVMLQFMIDNNVEAAELDIMHVDAIWTGTN